MSVIQRKARIFNIQKYNMYDGPGVRTIVFFKGCPLRCKWCSNPEGQLRQFQVLYRQSSCIHCGACVSVCPTGVHRMSAEGRHEFMETAECVGCRKCESACNAKALAVAGEQKTIAELMDVIEEDRPFYELSGGGVTLGGGEVLMQPEAATSLLMTCRQRGIHTAIETCGYAQPAVVMRAAEFTDLFLYDVKLMDSERHYAQTGVHNEGILNNLTCLLENRSNVMVRVPLLKGVNDDEQNLSHLVEFLNPYKEYRNFKGIELLPYHKMGVGKYSQLRWEYPVADNPELDDADLTRIEGSLRHYRFPVSVVRH